MDKENIIGIVKELTASERVQFIELLNEYTLADKKYSELIKTVFENINAIASFRSIQLRYQKLLILQYSKT